MSSTGNCDPEDARFERLESTGSSAEINNLLSYLKHKVFCLEKKRKEKYGMLPPLIMFFFCLGWPSEHKGLLVTDTACLCLIPVCMLYQDTRDTPYAYITRIDLCSHQRGPIFRPIIVYTRWYSEHTLS